MSDKYPISPVVELMASRGMPLGEPTASDAQFEMGRYLDKVMAPDTAEVQLPPKASRLRKAIAKVALTGAIGAGIVGAGIAIYNEFDQDRIVNPDQGNPEDTNHTDDTVTLPDGTTVAVSDPGDKG